MKYRHRILFCPQEYEFLYFLLIILCIGFIAAAIIGSLFLNSLNLEMAIPLPMPLIPSAVCLMAAGYASWRKMLRISEIALYFGIFGTLSWCGVIISYCAALVFPFQDHNLAIADHILGFNWILWARWVELHPALRYILHLAYQSHAWQPAVLVIWLAIWGPRHRNAEFAMSLSLALLLTLIVSVFTPAIGPADALGIESTQRHVLTALRYGSTEPLPYTGIISFPSFHTQMALLFVAAARRVRYAFPIFASLNTVMLLAVPYEGNHYLIDMIGGTVVAAVALYTTRLLLRDEDIVVTSSLASSS